MAEIDPARNLLFGILALQMDFIRREDLLAAASQWVRNKTDGMGQILVEQGALAEDAQGLLEPLVDKHLELHRGDPETSLASITPVDTFVCSQLQSLGDRDLEKTLSCLPIQSEEEEDRYSTVALGAPTSEGERFRVLRPHARGGLGEVFIAEDQELHREVALKKIQVDHARDAESRARFLWEAEITGRLEHPGVVPVYGLGYDGRGQPFYAMRFIRGDDFRGAIERVHRETAARSPERETARRRLLGRFVHVCNAMQYAHSRGVLHRDLKPGNVMLGPYGETLVVDWGLAKSMDREDRPDPGADATLRPTSGSGTAPTQLGRALGTPAYMSPEQASGRLAELGPRSDVFSLGATLYHLLAGRSPHPAKDPVEALRQAQAGEYVAPREVEPSVPAALNAVCLKAMARRPEERYESAAALADEVDRWMADEPVAAHPESLAERSLRWARRHRSWASAGLVSLALIAAATTVACVLVDQARRRMRSALRAEEHAVDRLQQSLDRENRTNSALEIALAEKQTALATAKRKQAEAEEALQVAASERSRAKIAHQMYRSVVRDTGAAVLGGQSVPLDYFLSIPFWMLDDVPQQLQSAESDVPTWEIVLARSRPLDVVIDQETVTFRVACDEVRRGDNKVRGRMTLVFRYRLSRSGNTVTATLLEEPQVELDQNRRFTILQIAFRALVRRRLAAARGALPFEQQVSDETPDPLSRQFLIGLLLHRAGVMHQRRIRSWTIVRGDNSRKIFASLLGLTENGGVRLRALNGSEGVVRRESLSEADRAYLERSLRRKRPPRETAPA